MDDGGDGSAFFPIMLCIAAMIIIASTMDWGSSPRIIENSEPIRPGENIRFTLSGSYTDVAAVIRTEGGKKETALLVREVPQPNDDIVYFAELPDELTQGLYEVEVTALGVEENPAQWTDTITIEPARSSHPTAFSKLGGSFLLAQVC